MPGRTDGEGDVAGPGNGYVDVYDTQGNLLRRFASNGPLDSPWGMVVAPPGFGDFGGALLIGNFGDGRINAFDPNTGAFLGALRGPNGAPLAIEGLWGLLFGNGGNGEDISSLYFTAGIAGTAAYRRPRPVRAHLRRAAACSFPSPRSVKDGSNSLGRWTRPLPHSNENKLVGRELDRSHDDHQPQRYHCGERPGQFLSSCQALNGD